MFRGGFAWPNAVQNMSGERQWKRKKIESIPEYWSEMSRRSPGKKESLDSLTTREISLTRSCRNLSALIKWETSPVYLNLSFVQNREFKIQRCGRQLERQKKKTIGLISKTTTSHVQHTFLFISLLFLHDYDVKMPNFAFYGGRKQATKKFYFSFWAWIWSLKIQLQEDSPTID